MTYFGMSNTGKKTRKNRLPKGTNKLFSSRNYDQNEEYSTKISNLKMRP